MVKGLFATAFRAPSYRELHSTNGVIAGDPNNKAEKIMTGELVFGAAPIRQLTATVSLFMSSLTDMIYKSPQQPLASSYTKTAQTHCLASSRKSRRSWCQALEVAAKLHLCPLRQLGFSATPTPRR